MYKTSIHEFVKIFFFKIKKTYTLIVCMTTFIYFRCMFYDIIDILFFFQITKHSLSTSV